MALFDSAAYEAECRRERELKGEVVKRAEERARKGYECGQRWFDKGGDLATLRGVIDDNSPILLEDAIEGYLDARDAR